MSMQTDVKSQACAAGTNTTVTSTRSRIKAITISYPTSGTVAITDGSGGATLYSFTAPAAVGSINILLPGEGILAYNGIYVTCAATTTAIVVYA